MSHKRKITCIVLAVFCIMLVMAGCSESNRVVSYPQGGGVNVNDDASQLGKVTAVIKEINRDKGFMIFVDVESDKEIVFQYNGGVEITNKYGDLLTLEQIGIGEIVDLTYEDVTNKLHGIQISKDSWEVKELSSLKINITKKSVDVLNTNYYYTDGLIVASDDELIELLEISESDHVTVRGYKGKLNSIVVDLGHGYISLKNYDTFIGGMISIGNRIILPVSDDMLIVATEGTYKLQIEKDGHSGVKNIVVKRNEETKVNLAKLQIPPVQTGKIFFTMKPGDSILRVDGKLYETNEPIELEYGIHKIHAVKEGFETYTGSLLLDQPYINYMVELSEEEIDTEDEIPIVDNNEDLGDGEDDEPSSNPDQSGTGSTGSNSDSDLDSDSTQDSSSEEEDSSTSSTTDSNKPNKTTKEKIYVTGPQGAKVYVDNIYKGVAPVNFPKVVGSHVITLSKSGYLTKSYTVEAVDDGEHSYLSFPAMLKLNK